MAARPGTPACKNRPHPPSYRTALIAPHSAPRWHADTSTPEPKTPDRRPLGERWGGGSFACAFYLTAASDDPRLRVWQGRHASPKDAVSPLLLLLALIVPSPDGGPCLQAVATGGEIRLTVSQHEPNTYAWPLVSVPKAGVSCVVDPVEGWGDCDKA